MRHDMKHEETIWRGTPSQMTNLGVFIVCALFFWLILPIFIALWRWLSVRCTVYELTTQRLKFSKGVFNKWGRAEIRVKKCKIALKALLEEDFGELASRIKTRLADRHF